MVSQSWKERVLGFGKAEIDSQNSDERVHSGRVVILYGKITYVLYPCQRAHVFLLYEYCTW